MSDFVINSLKSVKEKLDKNFSSYDLLTTLDTLLLRSVLPILKNSKYIERNLSLVVGWYTNAARRKLSSNGSKDEFNTRIAELILAKPEEKALVWKKLCLERTLTFHMVSSWLEELRDWPTYRVKNDIDAMTQCENAACLLDRENVFPLIQEVDFWLKKAVEFKHMLVEKYMRLAMLEATTYYKIQKQNNPHLSIMLDDVAQNFILAVSKAIDKCDANRGTITSYVQTWLHDAKSTVHFSHEYGTAYSLPNNKKRGIVTEGLKINNIAVSLDHDEVQEMKSTDNVEENVMAAQVVNRVRILAKAADPVGLGRIALQIGEHLSSEELRLLNRRKRRKMRGKVQ